LLGLSVMEGSGEQGLGGAVAVGGGVEGGSDGCGHEVPS
jgi:hypothetical protein